MSTEPILAAEVTASVLWLTFAYRKTHRSVCVDDDDDGDVDDLSDVYDGDTLDYHACMYAGDQCRIYRAILVDYADDDPEIWSDRAARLEPLTTHLHYRAIDFPD